MMEGSLEESWGERHPLGCGQVSRTYPTKNSKKVRIVSKMDRIVKLNVGGKKFITSLSTLGSRGPNFFTVMLENDNGSKVRIT